MNLPFISVIVLLSVFGLLVLTIKLLCRVLGVNED